MPGVLFWQRSRHAKRAAKQRGKIPIFTRLRRQKTTARASLLITPATQAEGGKGPLKKVVAGQRLDFNSLPTPPSLNDCYPETTFLPCCPIRWPHWALIQYFRKLKIFQVILTASGRNLFIMAIAEFWFLSMLTVSTWTSILFGMHCLTSVTVPWTMNFLVRMQVRPAWQMQSLASYEGKYKTRDGFLFSEIS